MLQTALTVTVVLTVALAVLIAATTAVRVGRSRASQRSANLRASLRAHVVTALGLRPGDTALATASLVRAVRWHRAELVDILTSVATTIGDDARPEVVALCDTLDLTGPLLKGLHHPEPARRVAAAEIVGLFGGPELTSALHLAMRDPHPRVRLAGARAYLATNPRAAAAPILRMLRQETPDVAGELAELLRQEGGTVAPALLREWAQGTRTPLLVSLIAHAADQTAALIILTDAAASPDPALRRAAVTALATIPTTLALSALTDATGDTDPDVRAAAAAALGVLAGPETIPVLIALLDDRSWAVRHRAAAALASTPDGTRLLAGLLGQATPFVTTAVTTALQRTLTTGGLLADLTDADPAAAARAQRAVRALAARPEMTQVLRAALVRHPDAAIRGALARLAPDLSPDAVTPPAAHSGEPQTIAESVDAPVGTP